MTDHDAIAARVRQDRMSGTMLTGPVYIKLADMADAYLDLYDEVQRLRAERDALISLRDCLGNFWAKAEARAEKAEAERIAEWNKRRDAESSLVLEKAVCLTAEAERDRLRAALTIYAQSGNWRLGGCCDPNSPNFTGEAIARAALKGPEE